MYQLFFLLKQNCICMYWRLQRFYLVSRRRAQFIMDAVTWVLTLWAFMDKKYGTRNEAEGIFLRRPTVGKDVEGERKLVSLEVCVGDTGSISMIRYREHTHWIFFNQCTVIKTYCLLHQYYGWVQEHIVLDVFVCDLEKEKREIWIHLNTFLCSKSNLNMYIKRHQIFIKKMYMDTLKISKKWQCCFLTITLTFFCNFSTIFCFLMQWYLDIKVPSVSKYFFRGHCMCPQDFTWLSADFFLTLYV